MARTQTVEILRALQPLHVMPDSPVFTNLEGEPIEPKAFSTHWYRCLRALGLPVRGLYATKDSYVSLAMSRGVDPVWCKSRPESGSRRSSVTTANGCVVKGATNRRNWPVQAPTVDPRPRWTNESTVFSMGKEVRGGGLEGGRPHEKPKKDRKPCG